jgi:Ala-tRNA(Pro) deacylase
MTYGERLEAYLRQQQVPYSAQHHRRTTTAHDTALTEHIPDEQLAKVVMVVADGQLTMLVLPASYTVDMACVRQIIEAQDVHLAREWEFAAAFPDCETGAMPPFGQLYGLPVYVDRHLAANATIVFPAGTHTDTICMAYADFARLVQPFVAAFGRRVPARFGCVVPPAGEHQRSDTIV